MFETGSVKYDEFAERRTPDATYISIKFFCFSFCLLVTIFRWPHFPFNHGKKTQVKEILKNYRLVTYCSKFRYKKYATTAPRLE